MIGVVRINDKIKIRALRRLVRHQMQLQLHTYPDWHLQLVVQASMLDGPADLFAPAPCILQFVLHLGIWQPLVCRSNGKGKGATTLELGSSKGRKKPNPILTQPDTCSRHAFLQNTSWRKKRSANYQHDVIFS